MKLSANLGFLWQDRPLPERIVAAAEHGFDAVECHFPYDVSARQIRETLESCCLPMVSLNTWLGKNGPDDFGVAARPDRKEEARQLIDQAIAYAAEINAQHVSVIPGKLERTAAAEATYVDNLTHACDQAGQQGIGILIEPINTQTAPGFYLHTVDQALATIDSVGRDNLKIMFDCFHIQIMQGNLLHRLRTHMSQIGHIQFASVPERAEPDTGEIDYGWLLNAVVDSGWAGYFGAEYHPQGKTEATLNWMQAVR